MKNIYDLSSYETYRLQSIDPILTPNWKNSLCEIMSQLDTESQNSIIQRILNPRGIYFDTVTQSFRAKKPLTLQQVISENILCSNTKLINSAKEMQTIFDITNTDVTGIDIADQIEAMLSNFDKIEIDETKNEHKIKNKLRKAFLYQLSTWINHVTFDVEQGIRQLNSQIAKIYFIEVFLKQQIQGWDFRYWDASDIDFIKVENFPAFLITEVKARKLYIVETLNYWFLVGQTEKSNKNPFSLRRFLYEDSQNNGEFVYITSVIVPKTHVINHETQKLILQNLSRLFTLEHSISEDILKFAQDIKHYQHKYLYPLLKKPLLSDGSDIETVIEKRMIDYEKQLTLLVLQKLPRMFQQALFNQTDQDFLYYKTDNFLRETIENIEDFTLQPLVRYSVSARTMLIRLLSFRLFLQKTRHISCDRQQTNDAKQQQLNKPITQLIELIEETQENINHYNNLKEQLYNFEQRQQAKKIWRLFSFIKKPQYTTKDLEVYLNDINENLFISIVRLAKQYREIIVYPEFEMAKIFDESYRHYVFLNKEQHFSQLPLLIYLPENRQKLDFNLLKRLVYRDFSKENQE